MTKRQKMTPEQQALMDQLVEVARNIPPERLALALAPTDKITFNVTPADKESIRMTAARFGLSMTDYIVRLHHAVSERIREEGRRK